jgi:hypothetical protein
MKTLSLESIFVKQLLLLSGLQVALLADNSLIYEFLNLEKTSYQKSNLHLSSNTLEYIDKVRIDSSYKKNIVTNNQQSYSARVYPKNFKAYELEKQHFQTEQNYVNQNLEKENIALQEKNYTLLIEAKFQKKMLDFFNKSMRLYENELKVKKALPTGNFYVESIFFLNRKLELFRLKKLKQEQLYRSSLRAIQSSLLNSYPLTEIEQALENYRLDSSSELIAKMEQSDFEELLNTGIEQKLDDQKEQSIQENIKLETLKEDFSFDFVELGYTNKQNQGESLAIGFGIDLPLKKSNQVKIMEEKLSLVELQEKSRVEDEIYLRQAKLLLEEAQSLYYYQQGLEELLSKDDFYQLYSQKEDADPRFILEVQERDLNAQEELLEVEQKLHENYIKLLVLTHGFNNTTLSPTIARSL